jgi:hypothetical protein
MDITKNTYSRSCTVTEIRPAALECQMMHVACDLLRNSNTNANKNVHFAETSNFHCDHFCVGPKITVRYTLDQQQFRTGGLRT